MSKLFLKWFGGMKPRMGEQHLQGDNRLEETGYFRRPQVNPNFDIETGMWATEAENCNLYSGELRPLHKPALAYHFCRPGDPCWHVPIPDDPSVPPEPPVEPPNCVPVFILYPEYECQYYECDAIETALLAVPGVVAAWTMIDGRNGDATDMDNIIPNAEDLSVTETVSPASRTITDIDPCSGSENFGYGDFGGGAGGVGWTVRSTLFELDFKKNHSMGAWVKLTGSADQLLPLFEVTSFVIWLVNPFTGNVQVTWAVNPSGQVFLDFGDIFPTDGEYHQIACHLDGETTTGPVSAWFEVDGTRVDRVEASSSLRPDVGAPGRLQLFSSDSLSQATLGCDYIYPWVADGNVSANVLIDLANAWSQNQVGYVDPNPLCIGAPCKYYECDAFQTSLAGIADYLWLLDDDPIGATVVDINQGWALTANPTLVHGDSLLPDACVGAGSMRAGTGSLRSLVDNPPEKTGYTGAMGAVYSPYGSLAIGTQLMTFGKGTPYTYDVYLSTAGNDVAVTVYGSGVAGGNETISFPDVLTGATFVLLNFTVDPGDYDALPTSIPPSFQWELFINFVSVGSSQITMPVGFQEITTSGNFQTYQGGSGDVWLQYQFYSNSRITGAEIDILADAWLQNQVGYVDPNENCVP